MKTQTSFPAHVLGNELIELYDKAGVQPFGYVEHQGQLTPFQRQVILETINYRNEKKKEAMGGGGGGGINLPKNGAATSSAEQRKQNIIKDQIGDERNVRYENQEFADADDPDDVPLVMDDDEVD